MKASLWGWTKRIGKVFGGVAFVAVVYFVVFVHPNDARIKGADLAGLTPPTKYYRRAAALLLDQLPHSINLDQDAYQAAKNRLSTVAPEATGLWSKRFTSPYEVYMPVGDYPVRLEAFDGLFIPAGATLSVDPKFAGHTAGVSVRFAGVAPGGAAKILVGLKGKAQSSFDLAALNAPIWANQGFWARQFARFLFVDRSPQVSRWLPLRLEESFEPGAPLTITCQAEKAPGCVVSDVAFYVPTAEKPKNLIVMLVDTLRADALNGGHAPVMQEFAAHSMDFRQAVAAGNMTSPSTNAFLSCRRPSDLGKLAFMYAVDLEQRERFYGDQAPSFPARFRANGFDTAMIGNVSVISEIYGVGVQHGFDQQISLERDAYDTPDITHDAVNWLAEHADHSFVLYLHYNGPHAPYRAPLRDIVSTFPGRSAIGSYGSILKWLYQSEVAYTDRYIDQVISAMKRLGIDDETTVVLTADHGDQHTNRRFAGNEVAPGFEGAYFDHGATLYQDEVHVPFVYHRPKQEKGVVFDGYVTTLSAGPTLLADFGISDEGRCAAASLKPSIDQGTLQTDVVAKPFGTEGFQGRAIVFDGRYKFIRTYEPTDKTIYPPNGFVGDPSLYLRQRQLFDLKTDPDEANDLSLAEPALLARAEGIYRAFYDIKDAFELVLDLPDTDRFDVVIPAAANAAVDDPGIAVSRDAERTRFSGEGRRRVIIRLHAWSGSLPEVQVAGTALPVTMTSMRVPLKVAGNFADLPREAGGRGSLLGLGEKPAAYLRKVEETGQSDRRIVTGNPKFESVLREWGYLNDR